jgi:lysozyme
MDLVRGIDVHGEKGKIDWEAVANHGIEFAIIKLTEGVDWIDKRAARNARRARDAGLKIGFYHFATPGRPGRRHDVLDEANDFLDALDQMGEWHIAPSLDLEKEKLIKASGVGRAELSLWAQVWCQYVAEQSGCDKCLYYSPLYFERGAMGDHDLDGRVHYWAADYHSPEGPGYPRLYEKDGFTSWYIHQCSSSWKVPGIGKGRAKVDGNVMRRCDFDALG